MVSGSGAAAVAIAVAVGVTLAGGGGSAGGSAQTAVCSGIGTAVSLHAANDPQSPDEAQSLSIALEWRSQMSNLVGRAQPGPLKNSLQEYIADLNAVISYLQTNPNLDMSDPPAQLVALENAFTSDGERARAICSS